MSNENMSESKIYVGNLSYDVTENELRDFFAQYGSIEDVKLIMDFNTGRSKGFGFITFATEDGSEKALSANGSEMSGRKLKVNAAKENNDRGGRGGRGGFGGRGNGGSGNSRDNFGNQDSRY